jgi:UDP-perosamine 4-acetyltransferase
MADIIVLGGGGHAKVLISTLKKLGYRVLGYVDPKDCGELLGIAHLGSDDILTRVRDRHPTCDAAIGVGKIDAASDLRYRLFTQLLSLGFGLPPIVSPQAMVNEETSLGAGTVVFDGAVVNSGTVVGVCCILNSNSTVEHDCRLGDNVHIAPGATLSGGVVLGDNCMVGTGANIIQGVHVGPGCMIGAGATVVRNLVEPGNYAGVPARRI